MDPKPNDLLSDDELALLLKMLRAVFDYPKFHMNRFQIQAKRGNRFEYFVGKSRSGGVLFPLTLFPSSIRGQLIALEFAELDKSPDAPNGTLRFTDKAETWYRAHLQLQAEVSDDAIWSELERT